MPPTVSVLLPAYNAASSLDAAVRSVLRQSFADFELMIVDDGSTDGTASLLAGYSDPRIRIVRNSTNRGLVAALNYGIELARGKYVARMDADDVAYRRRLERQLAFLEHHPDVGICGTWFRAIGDGRRTQVRTPTTHDEIAATLFFRSPFGHPTVVFRRSFLNASQLRYSDDAQHAEDFDLWVRARGQTQFSNIPEYLLDYRIHTAQISAGHRASQISAAARIRLRQLALLRPDASESEMNVHLRACDGHIFSQPDELLQVRDWLDRLGDANATRRAFPLRAFSVALASTWSHCCHRAAFAPQVVFRIFSTRRYSPMSLELIRRYAVFGGRALTARLSA